MKFFSDITLLFPITNPTWIFLIVLVIILFAPLLFNRIRVPHLVGMILAGVLVGEHGLNILTRDSSFELFGKVGLYYIMFLASLEMDLEGLKKNRTRGIIFGLITFSIPFILGYAVGNYVLGLQWEASLLFSCIISSHTLVAYPIVARYGLSRHDCVTIAIAGTMIALLLALLTLAGISASAKGDISTTFWFSFGLKCAVYCLIIFFCYPRLTRAFFKRYSDNVTQFTFVLALLIMSAALSELAGLEGLFGAFLAGLVLNRYIPRVSPLMNRIEFVGNALFIPYFLIGVGMLINVKSLFDHHSVIHNNVQLDRNGIVFVEYHADTLAHRLYPQQMVQAILDRTGSHTLNAKTVACHSAGNIHIYAGADDYVALFILVTDHDQYLLK